MSIADADTLFRSLDRELWLLTAQAGSQRAGLIATAVSQSSLSPETPRVLVGIAKHHHTWGIVETASAFALHLIGDAQMALVWRFGIRSGQDGDKLDGLSLSSAVTGSPILADAVGWLDCRVESRLDAGDRTIYLAEVVDAAWRGSGAPLTLKRMLALAPNDRLRELKEMIARDAPIEADAIRRWRESRTP